jgi:hypothetical protein
LTENINGGLSLRFIDDQRRAKTDGALPATQKEQALFEGFLDNLIPQLGVGRVHCVLGYQARPDHKAKSADVADGGISCLKIAEFVFQVTSDFSGVSD